MQLILTWSFFPVVSCTFASKPVKLSYCNCVLFSYGISFWMYYSELGFRRTLTGINLKLMMASSNLEKVKSELITLDLKGVNSKKKLATIKLWENNKQVLLLRLILKMLKCKFLENSMMENMKVQLKEMLENWKKPHWPKIILFVSSSLAGFTLILIILEYTRRIGSQSFKIWPYSVKWTKLSAQKPFSGTLKEAWDLTWTIWRRKDRMANNLIQQKQESYLIGVDQIHHNVLRTLRIPDSVEVELWKMFEKLDTRLLWKL